MSLPSHLSEVENDAKQPSASPLRAWADARAPVLLAAAFLIALLALLIVVSLVHPR